MGESSIEAHLESCRERVQSQDTVNSSYSTKALSTTTLSLTLFGIGVSTAGEGVFEFVLLGILSACLLLVSVISLGFIIRPRSWFIPCDLEGSEKLALTSKSKEEFLVPLAQSYRQATEYNEVVLRRKAINYTIVIVLVLIEVLGFATLISI